MMKAQWTFSNTDTTMFGLGYKGANVLIHFG